MYRFFGSILAVITIFAATACDDLSKVVPPDDLLVQVPVIDLSATANNQRYIHHDEPGKWVIPPILRASLIPPYGAVDTELPKVNTGTQFTANTWLVHGNADNVNDATYFGRVQSNEEIGGRNRGVLRFSKNSGQTANSGPFIRVPLGPLPVDGQWFYINTWLNLITISTASLPTQDNQAEYRIGIFSSETQPAGDGPIRSKVFLGNFTNNDGRDKPITTADPWMDYSFLVFVPQRYQNHFLEVRLFVPNSNNQITIDMTNVEMFAISPPSDDV